MKPDLNEVAAVLSRRLDLEALYLGGPFDAQGEPASPDIHVLAISRGDWVKDFHLVPKVSRFDRRVEVSVVPLGLVRRAVDRGVSTWFDFYTADKIRTGKPILESGDAARLRKRAIGNLRIRPAFYAEALRGVVHAGGHLVGPSDGRARAARAAGATEDTEEPARARPAEIIEREEPARVAGLVQAMALGGRLLAVLAVHTAVKSGRAFSKLSEMLARGGPWPAVLPEATKAEAVRTLESAAGVLERLLTHCGIDPACLAPASVPRGPWRSGTKGVTS